MTKYFYADHKIIVLMIITLCQKIYSNLLTLKQQLCLQIIN